MLRVFIVAPLLGACVITADGDRVVDQRTLELGLTDETAVELETRSGSLEVVGEPGRTSVEMDVTLVRFGGPLGFRSDAAGIDALVATLDTSGGVVRARSWVDLIGNDPFGTDVVLRVPSDLDVAVRDASGDLSVFDVASLDLDDDSGAITIENVPGSVTIDDDSGDVDVLGTGPLTIDDDSGSIDVEDVTGDVVIRDDSGDIRLSRVEGDVEIDDDSGSIWVSDVTGTVRIDDGSGDITIESVGDFDLRSDSSGGVVIR